jgi:translocation protein SEC63
MIMDIGNSPRKWRVQFQAPPQVATYMFNLHIKSDSYCGTDFIQEVLLEVQDASKLEEIIVEEVIPESEEGMSPGFIMLIC